MSRLKTQKTAVTIPRINVLKLSDVLTESAICVDQWESNQALLSAAATGPCRNFCAHDRSDLEAEISASTAMIAQPEKFLKDPTGVIMGSGGDLVRSSNRFYFRFSAAEEKSLMLDSLSAWLSAFISLGSARVDILLVADELFTNAVFNAPFINAETLANPGISREDKSVTMPDGFHGELLAEHDSERVVLACRDPFGRLSVRRYVSRLLRCELNGLGSSIDLGGGGGAGIGSCLIFKLSSSLYIGVKANSHTVLASIFFWKLSGRKRSSMAKSLHFFEVGR